MPDEPASNRHAHQSQGSIGALMLMRLRPALFYSFIAITVAAIFLPLNPAMPVKGIDASWEFAMNEAVARHMSIGQQVVFTYGPYASIGDRSYSPATDRRMMWGSIFVGGCYITALFFVARGRKRYLMLLLLLYLAMFGNTELLLLSYSFLLVICVLREDNSNFSHDGKPRSLNWRLMLAACMSWSTLGLLPLIKGSLLLPFAASVAIPSALLICRFRFKAGLALLFIPLAAAAGLWAVAGQSFAALPAFLRGTVLLTSGYTEAMSTSWTILPGFLGDLFVVLFLLLSALLCWSVVRSAQLTAVSKWMLVLLWGVYLLVIFKHGFVKAEGVRSAYGSLAALIVIMAFLYVDRCIVWSLSIALILAVGTSVMGDIVLIQQVHDRFGTGVTWGGESRADIFEFCLSRAAGGYARSTYKSAWKTYADAWIGLRSRTGGSISLEDRYSNAVAKIRESYPIPALSGSADIYTYEESALLASKNEWNPRPVFQSYSAYTPELASLNEQHLRGQDAPDWVLFDLQTIDGRLPSLDDGVSWPALFDNYTFVSYDGRFTLLRKKEAIHQNSNYERIYNETCKIGSTVSIPNADGLLFAEVDLKPTMAGRLLTAFFSPPQLRIVLGLADGTTKKYRVVSNMMSTGFLVSPFVANTKDFAALAAQNTGQQKAEKVGSISISPSYGGSIYWSDTYVLTLKRYVGQ
jgi:hypothetical protein